MSTETLVSVIVPARDEELHVGACLDSLILQDLPSCQFEIILVDNESRDQTPNIGVTKGVKVLSCSAETIGGVRNFGVSNSSGQYIAFLDGDCIAKPYWLKKALDDTFFFGPIAIGGDPLGRDGSSWVETLWALPRIRSNDEKFSLNGCSMFFERSIFQKIGGFDAKINSNEDRMFSDAIASHAVPVLWREYADVTHCGFPQTLSQFFKRQFWLSSSYIRTNSGLKDKTFILSLLNFIGIVGFIFGVVFGLDYFSLFSIFMFIAGPILLSAKRIYASKIRLNFFQTLGVFALSCVYFVGRGFGLMYSFFGKVYRRSKV